MRFILALAAAAAIAGPVAAAPRQAPTMVVQFAWDSDALDAAGRARLDRAVEAHRKDPSLQIVVAGHAGPDENTPEYAVGLSQRRANTVREYLAGRGVPPRLLITQAFGQRRPAAEATDPAAHRRVEVIIGGDSGW